MGSGALPGPSPTHVPGAAPPLGRSHGADEPAGPRGGQLQEHALPHHAQPHQRHPQQLHRGECPARAAAWPGASRGPQSEPQSCRPKDRAWERSCQPGHRVPGGHPRVSFLQSWCEDCGGISWARWGLQDGQRESALREQAGSEAEGETGLASSGRHLWPGQSRALCWPFGLCAEAERRRREGPPGEEWLLKQPGHRRLQGAGARRPAPRPAQAAGSPPAVGESLGWNRPAGGFRPQISA